MIKKLFSKPLFLLCIIILLAAFLRFYQLATLPPSLTWDEVAWGYNAYALGIDGKDEFGKYLPYDYLLSFGDYKPPLYAYLAVVPIWIFGLTELAVRFPSALFGTLTVLVTYFLVKEVFYESKKGNKSITNRNEALPLLSALFLAISPWHIMLSRAAFEANVATFLVITGVWFFLKAMHTKAYWLILSTVLFVLSIYTFNSTRIVAPLLFVVLVVVNYKALWKQKKYVIISCILGIIMLLPIVKFLISPEAKLRYEEVNIFSDVSIVENANQETVNDNNSTLSKILHNRRIAYTREYLSHYLDHFNPNFLFISGDKNIKFSTQDVGQLYLWDLPFLLIGLLYLFKRREKHWWLIPIWLLIGIIPAAAARETPHALRIESSLPTWQILSAYGVVTFFSFFKRFKKSMVTVLALSLAVFTIYFLFGYYTHYAKAYSAPWQYGYKNVIQYISQNHQRYDRIEIAERLERPYIYTLFYLKYDPKTFRKEAVITGNDFGFVHIESFNKYYFFRDITTVNDANKKTLYIDAPKYLPKGAKTVHTFTYLNGETSFVAFTK